MQDVAAAFYEFGASERPKTEDEFVIWAHRLSGMYLRKRRYGSRKEKPLVSMHDEFTGADLETEIHGSEIGWHHQRPTQLISLMAMDVLRNIEKLPSDMRKICYRLIDSGDVTEYAIDHDVNLFDAMKEIKHAQTIMRRILDDEADEKKLSND